MNLGGGRVLVVGLAESGLAVVEALRELGAEVTVTETMPGPAVSEAAARAEALGARVLTGGHEGDHLDGADLVVTSPGVPERAPILTWAAQRGVEVWSELELGARLATAPYVAVTGTNGKTTTTELIAAAMRADGLDAIACGNVGYPFSRAAREHHDALVVEASSFQLRFQRSLHPRVSVLLNLTPDHLDWHVDLDAYAGAKASIYRRQGRGDVHVGNLDDPVAAAISRRAPCRQAWFTQGDPAEAGAHAGFGFGTTMPVAVVGDDMPERELVVEWDEEIHGLGRPPMAGPARRANAAAAALAAIAFGVAPDAVGKALHAYEPGAYRGRVVAEAGGVRFVDDSKATNPHAALASIADHDRVVLIAGGLAKGVDLAPLAEAAPRLAAVVAIGEAAGTIAAVFDGLVPVTPAGSMEEAVKVAAGLASGGDTVLLAPACASQDMFRDYRERGDRFGAAARRLAERGSDV